MAGDWIKLTHAVLDKPEIRRTARMLGISYGDALELYLRWWVWLDVNSVDGLVDQLVDQDVDDQLHCPGLAACMREVGWLATDDATGKLRVNGFDSHNGESSKKRALSNKKQAKWRANVDAGVDHDVDHPRSTEASTREEKRREDKDIGRATRLPGDWSPSVEDQSFALKHLSRSALSLEAQKFKNHFASAAGARGRKLDWSATWRNWVLNSIGYGAEKAVTEARRVAL